ncbi:MAG: ABC transporter substrate-binding protein [Clostridiales bacterium]|nr:ABC transporter substrate-binding protein [Candidatus Crickella equi]
MKKFLALMLSVLMVFSLTACGGSDSSDSGDQIKIGVMQFGEFTALQNCYDGFVAGLEEAGYKDGENIKINMQSAAADTANCPTIADTLINDESDLVFAIATPSASAMKEKTTDIPVLFSAVTDAVASQLVASNEEPGGNISGTSDMNPVAEQIDLIKELLPKAKKVAVFYCSSESNSAAQYELAKAQIEKDGMECVQKTISTVDEAKSAIESLKGQVDCIYVPTDNTVSDAMALVSETANSVGLPIVCGEPGMVENGATLTFGIDYTELGKQTAAMAVKLLQSDDPLAEIAKMPVEFQTKECVTAINMASVAALGLDVPQSILDRAERMGE